MSRRDRLRDAAIVAAYADGLTLYEVGARFGISDERVRQVLAREGITRRKRGARTGDSDRLTFALTRGALSVPGEDGRLVRVTSRAHIDAAMRRAARERVRALVREAAEVPDPDLPDLTDPAVRSTWGEIVS